MNNFRKIRSPLSDDSNDSNPNELAHSLLDNKQNPNPPKSPRSDVRDVKVENLNSFMKCSAVEQDYDSLDEFDNESRKSYEKKEKSRNIKKCHNEKFNHPQCCKQPPSAVKRSRSSSDDRENSDHLKKKKKTTLFTTGKMPGHAKLASNVVSAADVAEGEQKMSKNIIEKTNFTLFANGKRARRSEGTSIVDDLLLEHFVMLDKRKFMCNFDKKGCGKIVNRRWNIEQHIRKAHLNVTEAVVKVEASAIVQESNKSESSTVAESSAVALATKKVEKIKLSYKCPVCGSKYTSVGHTKLHIEKLHGKEKPMEDVQNLKNNLIREYSCPRGDFTNTDKKLVYEHIKKNHPDLSNFNTKPKRRKILQDRNDMVDVERYRTIKCSLSSIIKDPAVYAIIKDELVPMLSNRAIQTSYLIAHYFCTNNEALEQLSACQTEPDFRKFDLVFNRNYESVNSSFSKSHSDAYKKFIETNDRVQEERYDGSYTSRFRHNFCNQYKTCLKNIVIRTPALLRKLLNSRAQLKNTSKIKEKILKNECRRKKNFGLNHKKNRARKQRRLENSENKIEGEVRKKQPTVAMAKKVRRDFIKLNFKPLVEYDDKEKMVEQIKKKEKNESLDKPKKEINKHGKEEIILTTRDKTYILEKIFNNNEIDSRFSDLLDICKPDENLDFRIFKDISQSKKTKNIGKWWRFLPFLKRLQTKIVKKTGLQENAFALFPIMALGRKHVSFDKCSTYEFCTMLRKRLKLKGTTLASMAQETVDFKSCLRLFEQVFDLSRFKKLNDYFAFSITTDGITASVHFHPKKVNKGVDNYFKTKAMEFGGIPRNKEFDKRVGYDPGLKLKVATFAKFRNQKNEWETERFKLSSRKFHSLTGHYCRNEKSNRWLAAEADWRAKELVKSEYANYCRNNANDMNRIMKFNRERFNMFQELFTRPRMARLKFDKYNRTQSTVDLISQRILYGGLAKKNTKDGLFLKAPAKNIKKSKKIFFACGYAKINSIMRGYLRTPLSGFQRSLQLALKQSHPESYWHRANEYYTTQLCPSCNKSAKVGKSRHRFVHCNSCKRSWNRDLSAAENILGTSLVTTKVETENYMKNYKNFKHFRQTNQDIDIDDDTTN